jgi:hypothetical protein
MDRREITMLKSYEAIVENGQVKWLAEQPELKSARVIITILEETVLAAKGAESLIDRGLKLEELGGSEPQVQDIPRRRYDI